MEHPVLDLWRTYLYLYSVQQKKTPILRITTQHPVNEFGSTMEEWRVGMRRRTDFRLSEACLLAGQSVGHNNKLFTSSHL